MSTLHIVDHPLIQHKLSIMRNKKTGSKDFRELLDEISMLMGYEITRNLPLEDVEIETPICKCTTKMLAGKKLGIVPILRAGLGMVDGLRSLSPTCRVGGAVLEQFPGKDEYRRLGLVSGIRQHCKVWPVPVAKGRLGRQAGIASGMAGKGHHCPDRQFQRPEGSQ